jgi:hypothetical protein
VYGQKRKADGVVDYEVHVDQIKDQVCSLCNFFVNTFLILICRW